jgi:tight adherence protein B
VNRRRPLPARAAAAALAAASLAAGLVLASAPAAHAAEGSIVGYQRSGDGLQLSVEVPVAAEVDLGGVATTVGGTAYDSAAELIDSSEPTIARTVVLAIDTSNSMTGDRFAAAKAAADTFLDSVPDDVEVGLVSFDSDVTVELEPSLDRDRAREVVAALTLSQGTLLNDAVIEAVALTGDDGQRSVLVLSDGADTSTTPLSDATTAITDSQGVVVDVVALEQTGAAQDALSLISQAGGGEVVSADSASLTAAFSDQAEVLSRQVAVSVDVPDDVAAGQVEVQVTLPSSAGDVVAVATLPAVPVEQDTDDGGLGAIPAAPDTSSGGGTPAWLMYAGVVVFGLGLALTLVLLVPRRPVAMSAAERVSTYTHATFGTPDHAKDQQPETPLTQQASDAIADVLKRNQSLDERISQRLEGAGSELKSSEWLLLHGGLFLAVTAVGLLLGRGNVVVGLVFMVLGVVGPWMYLGLRASQRRKKFNAALPETLQLMSGSLSAGLSLMQSVDTIVREGAEPVASAFKRVLVETRIGVPLEDALDGVADRFDSRDFRWVVMAIRIQRQVGGNLAELLGTVSATMREREYMRRQVAALAAEGKLSAIVLGALPPLFLLYLLLTQGDYVTPLFTEPLGLVMLIGGGLWLSVGIFWMSKLVKVEV